MADDYRRQSMNRVPSEGLQSMESDRHFAQVGVGHVPEDSARAREFVDGAFVGDHDMPVDYEEGFQEEGQPYYDEDAGVDVDGDDSQDSELDHSRLFVIIEEGMPRPNENKQLTGNELAARKEVVEQTYERIRKWLWDHPEPEDRANACEVRGTNDATCLHNVCKLSNPPADIIVSLLEASVEMASVTDSHGWLPLHHACANGASGDVLRLLTEAYPEGKTLQDSQKRTPLHFYLAQRSDNPNSMAENVEFLSDNGAAELPDVGGMLPMHYACAYGVVASVLEVLAEAYPDSLVARENNDRVPFHLALVNAHRDASPGVVEFLIRHAGAETVNMRDRNGYLPLHLLALGLKGFHPETHQQRQNVADCLRMYLGAEPIAQADFLTALQDLPDWLQDTAVVSLHVRNILNQKIVQRFPTMILMLDGYMIILLIVTFEITTRNEIDYRAGDPAGWHSDVELYLVFLGGIYFLLREIIQFISLLNLGNVSAWFWDANNWLDICLITTVLYFAIIMTDRDCYDENNENACPGISDRAFQNGAAFAKGVLWVYVISYLKSTLVDFAVFVGGVFYVLQRLVAFLIAVGVILLAFAQMFYIVYTDTAICEDVEQGTEPCDDQFPHCSFDSSLLKVYTMMMGEIGDESRYDSSQIAQLLYVLYAFLVVILLSNVLIAIVTDSYEVIQNDRAAIVFWSNRLDFVAEMDAVTFGLRNKMRLGGDGSDGGLVGQEGPAQEPYNKKSSGTSTAFYDGWKNLMQLFDQHLYDDIDMSPSGVEFWFYILFRGLAIVFFIPLWIVAGFLTVGWLWPPQIRQYLFVQKETKISRSDVEKRKLNQLHDIQNDIQALKLNLRHEMAMDRSELSRMKSEVDAVQGEVLSDLQQVRELMTTLLELGRS